MQLHNTNSKMGLFFTFWSCIMCYSPDTNKTTIWKYIDRSAFQYWTINMLQLIIFLLYVKNFILMKKTFLASTKVVGGHFLSSRNIIEETQPLKVIIGQKISSTIFNVIQSPSNPLILGLHGLCYIIQI